MQILTLRNVGDDDGDESVDESEKYVFALSHADNEEDYGHTKSNEADNKHESFDFNF